MVPTSKQVAQTRSIKVARDKRPDRVERTIKRHNSAFPAISIVYRGEKMMKEFKGWPLRKEEKTPLKRAKIGSKIAGNGKFTRPYVFHRIQMFL